MKPHPLECQRCGELIRMLTPEETRTVAVRPFDFVVYCWQCRHEDAHDLA